MLSEDIHIRFTKGVNWVHLTEEALMHSFQFYDLCGRVSIAATSNFTVFSISLRLATPTGV